MIYKMYTKKELSKILDNHKEWLADSSKGCCANLSFADLSSANLRSADLRSANLYSADLSSANLSSADLSFANLSFADLRSADLRSADLSFADLRSADLRSADLSFANLYSANLLIFQYQRHTAYFTLDGSLRIGCHYLPISEWLASYRELGLANNYTEDQLEAYGDFIKLCLKTFERNSKDQK